MFTHVSLRRHSRSLALVVRRSPRSGPPARLRRAGQSPALPTVVVLATGGTIAGAAASDVQAGYSSGQLGVDQLINAVPKRRSSRS